MANIDDAALGKHLDKLTKEKLGSHLVWRQPQYDVEIGPHDPTVYARYDESRLAVVSECKSKLSTYSDKEILIIALNQKDDPDEVAKEWHGFLRTEINKLQRMRPPWFAGGFGNIEYKADFKYWAQSNFLTNHETMFLTLGVEPKHFGEKKVMKMAEQYERGDDLWLPLEFMLRRREQIERQFPHFVHRGKFSPQEFFEWVNLVGLEIHPEFTSRYLKNSPSDDSSEANNRSAQQPDNKTDKREIDTIMQLFAAMAIRELGYDPEAKRSPIPNEIAELAAELGLNISDETIRKYLRRGASFLPPD